MKGHSPVNDIDSSRSTFTVYRRGEEPRPQLMTCTNEDCEAFRRYVWVPAIMFARTSPKPFCGHCKVPLDLRQAAEAHPAFPHTAHGKVIMSKPPGALWCMEEHPRLPSHANYVICCERGDWSGFRTIRECVRQFDEFHEEYPDARWYWVEER